jgi:glucose/arabinose dehydrogenase
MIFACGGGGGGGGSDFEPVIELTDAFPNITFNKPTGMWQAPEDDSRWFAAEKSGTLWMFSNNAGAATLTTSLDLSGVVDVRGEGGLLGLAFHPSFSDGGDVFVNYTEGDPQVTVISRFAMNSAGIMATSSESVILSIQQPVGRTNHNGGTIVFSPDDGFLFIGMGDGGGTGDPEDNGQDPTTLLGAMLRVDVDGTPPYEIPAGNIFAMSATNRPEIFAWGLRNPWKFSFDPVTYKLWAGDVGQGLYEEVDLVESGNNYGWNIMEGNHCYNASSCDDTGLTYPVVEYDHDAGRSITGGYVYRGGDMPALVGHYIYGDFISGRIWGFPVDDPSPIPVLLAETGLQIVSFARDNDGELYVMDYDAGGVYKISLVP